MNHTELWDAILTWYSPSATHWICLYSLKHSFGNHNFRFTWHWLLKFLQPEWNLLNHLVTVLESLCFHTTNFFSTVINHFKLVQHKSKITWHVHLCDFQITHEMKQYTGCLKRDAPHWYDNDLLLRQVQWQTFGTRPVKNASFELEISNWFFLLLLYQLPGHAIFFCVSCLSNRSLSY